MEPLRKITYQYAHHDIPLECDVYDATNYTNDAPVFLFFHAGGLVWGDRTCVPPWLVQVRSSFHIWARYIYANLHNLPHRLVTIKNGL